MCTILPGSLAGTQKADMTDIAFFDFDGTITTRDSLPCFIRYAVGRARFIFGMIVLCPFILGYKTGAVPHQLAKERVLRYFFKEWTTGPFQQAAENFCQAYLDSIVRREALERIAWHRTRGHRVTVVSATPELILNSWCERHGLELIGTRLITEQGRITGRIKGRNCRGPEKVRRIHEEYDISQYDTVYAYGDSAGDREMLDMADVAMYKRFT